MPVGSQNLPTTPDLHMTEQLFDVPDVPDVPAAAVPAAAGAGHQPLAARLRPRRLDDLVGQEAVLSPGGPLRQMIDRRRVSSLLLWGPPGTGKTSIASVIAQSTDAVFVELSAVTAGVKDVRRVIDQARERRTRGGRSTVLFIDEIHRFNKSQQDALLPAVEDGTVALIGATTENPSFEINPPLRSRSILLRLSPLRADQISALVQRALSHPHGLVDTTITDDALDTLSALSSGDARVALTTLEAAAAVAGADPITVAHIERALAAPVLRYDKSGDNHYDQISAFIKSLRGSDPDAAVYWLVRMLETGEDPRFLARRMVILASEDVGLADPDALRVAVAAFQALDVIGLPEARFALAQAAVYLALAPKSNSITTALSRADAAVAALGHAEVPAHLRDAHYQGASGLGHGKGYRYPHDDPSGYVSQQYGPDGLGHGDIYQPSKHGVEPELGSWRPST